MRSGGGQERRHPVWLGGTENGVGVPSVSDGGHEGFPYVFPLKRVDYCETRRPRRFFSGFDRSWQDQLWPALGITIISDVMQFHWLATPVSHGVVPCCHHIYIYIYMPLYTVFLRSDVSHVERSKLLVSKCTGTPVLRKDPYAGGPRPVSPARRLQDGDLSICLN